MPSTYADLPIVQDAGPFGKDFGGNDPLPSATWTEGQRRGFEAVRARCDRALQATKTLPDLPQRGESVSEYQRRLLQGLKKHTVTCRGLNFDWGTPEKVSEVEPRLLREAIASPKRRGELVPIVLTDRTGREITEWVGDKNAWLNNFRGIGFVMTEINGRPPIIPAV